MNETEEGGNCMCITSVVKFNRSMMIDNQSLLALIQYDGDELSCPQFNMCCEILKREMGFWLEGVVQTTFAISGILANTISSLILASKGA